MFYFKYSSCAQGRSHSRVNQKHVRKNKNKVALTEDSHFTAPHTAVSNNNLNTMQQQRVFQKQESNPVQMNFRQSLCCQIMLVLRKSYHQNTQCKLDMTAGSGFLLYRTIKNLSKCPVPDLFNCLLKTVQQILKTESIAYK